MHLFTFHNKNRPEKTRLSFLILPFKQRHDEIVQKSRIGDIEKQVEQEVQLVSRLAIQYKIATLPLPFTALIFECLLSFYYVLFPLGLTNHRISYFDSFLICFFILSTIGYMMILKILPDLK